jgi:ribosome recycling factor
MSSYKYLPIESINKILTNLNTNLNGLRSGRISTALVDDLSVSVPSWGGYFPLKQVAALTVASTSQMIITPYDKGTLNAIEKAIRESPLGVSPINDGFGAIKLNFPPMTEEERKKRAKLAGDYAEDAKISIKNLRREVLDEYKASFDKAEISEDEHKRIKDAVQKEVDKANIEIMDILAKKREEIMKV